MHALLTKTLILAAAVLTLAIPTRASEPETAPLPTRSVKVAAKLKTPTASARVRLNTANRIELQRLPGVGLATAQAILVYRADSKGFVDIRELQNVRGIGRRRFERLAPFVAL